LPRNPVRAIMVEAMTVESTQSAQPNPFVLKILISKFFENHILRDTVSQNPRWARLSALSKEKNNLEI
jgi:hypothetical protein